MAVELFHDVRPVGPSGAAGFLPVPESLDAHVEALVWSRFEASEAPCTTRLMPHGGLLLVVGTARRDQVPGSPAVSHMGLRRLTDGQATLRTQPSGCLTLFALLTPIGAISLMRHARVGDSADDRWALSAMVGQLEERRLEVAIEREASALGRLHALAAWLEQYCLGAATLQSAQRFAHALALLHERPGMSLADVELATGVGRRNLERKLRSWLGTSPRQQQRFSKVQLSAKLGWQCMKPAEIALEVGFADQAHSSRTINAMTGMTARRFMRRMDTPLAQAFRHATAGGNLMPCSFESTPLAKAA